MSNSTSNCPCGLTGDNCSEFVESISNIDDTPDGLCAEEGFDRCLISDGEATCVCNCGYTGDLCDETVTPLVSNFRKVHFNISIL